MYKVQPLSAWGGACSFANVPHACNHLTEMISGSFQEITDFRSVVRLQEAASELLN